MDIDRFFKTVLSQNAEELRKFFQKNAVIKWHCTNEVFTLVEYIKANCEYPGNWNGEIERIEENANTIILACRVFPRDNIDVSGKSLSSIVSSVKSKVRNGYCRRIVNGSLVATNGNGM